MPLFPLFAVIANKPLQATSLIVRLARGWLRPIGSLHGGRDRRIVLPPAQDPARPERDPLIMGTRPQPATLRTECVVDEISSTASAISNVREFDPDALDCPAYNAHRMFTAGVDLASQDRNTGICMIDWANDNATVVDLEVGAADAVIVDLVATVEKLGIDTPLGWPIAFAEAVARHSDDGSWPSGYRHENTTDFRLRRTDVWIWRDLGLPQPLSVSTDRIALPAMRAASLLSLLAERMPLDGSGIIVEVYPAAALNQWGLTSRGYKGRHNTASRAALISQFRAATNGWLTLSRAHEDLCRSSDDAFDALIAALVARAAQKSLVEPIPRDDQAFALREGWIAIPLKDSLSKLSAQEQSP